MSHRFALIVTLSLIRLHPASCELFWADVISTFVRAVEKYWGFPTEKVSGWGNALQDRDLLIR